MKSKRGKVGIHIFVLAVGRMVYINDTQHRNLGSKKSIYSAVQYASVFRAMQSVLGKARKDEIVT